jgi:hypothetical protein
MNVIKKIILLFVVVFSITSCEDYLDINKNPNSTDKIGPEYLFNYAAVAFSANKNGGDGSIPIGFASQVWGTGNLWGVSNSDRYYFGANFGNNNWSGIYVNTGKNLKQAITIAEQMVPKRVNDIAQCMILQAYNYYSGSILFGDIPFEEAINLDISQPKFDSQKDVLDGVLKMLDDAIAMIDKASPLKIKDYYYEGDMSKWEKLAKSIKLKILMLMVDADPTKESQIKALIDAGGMISSAEDAMLFPWIAKTGNSNPMYAIGKEYYADGIDDIYPSKAMVDIMNNNKDPRRSTFLLPGYLDTENKVRDTVYTGLLATLDRVKDTVGTTSVFNDPIVWAGDKEDELFTYSEQLLLEAECQVRFYNDLAEARKKYEAALKASCARWEVTSGVDEFIANLPAFTDATVAKKMIYEEFWVDQFVRPLDAWTTWRRSGTIGNEIPTLTKPKEAKTGGAGGEDMFRTAETPTDATAANKNSPDGLKYYDRMWFDK